MGLGIHPCFAPIEFLGAPLILTLDGAVNENYVLPQKGYENISFTSVKKVCCKPMELDLMIKTFAEAEEKNHLE